MVDALAGVDGLVFNEYGGDFMVNLYYNLRRGRLFAELASGKQWSCASIRTRPSRPRLADEAGRSRRRSCHRIGHSMRLCSRGTGMSRLLPV